MTDVPDRGAVPADRLLVGATDGPRHQDHGHDDQRDALERHHDARLTHGRRRGNDHDGQRRGSHVRLVSRARRADREPERHVDHSRRTRPARARAGEQGQPDRRPHRPPRSRHRDRQGRGPRRHRRGDRARRRRHGERGGQRHPRRLRPGSTRPRGARGRAWCPAGSANVFARALGISPDPTEATNQLVDLLDEHRRGAAWRRIGLMDCGERWGGLHRGHGRGRRGGGRRRGAAREGSQGHRVALHPRGRARDAGRRPQGADIDAAPARPRADHRRALRVRVELQPVDVRQHPTGVDQSRRRRSRRVWASSR